MLAFGQVKVPAAALPTRNRVVHPAAMAPEQMYGLGPAPRASLGPLSDAVRSAPPPRRGLLRVAAQRPMSAALMNQGVWQNTASGPIWRLSVQSENAIGIRLHFTNFSVGSGQVWVHDVSNPPRRVLGPYTGKGRNNDGDFWTEVLFADTAEIEYRPAPGTPSTGTPPFQIGELSHLWQFGTAVSPRGASSAAPAFQSPKASSTQALNFQCLLDASCYTNPSSGTYVPGVGDGVRSTAFIVFSDSTGSYQCSATLLNAPNASPLLLTAGHCINTEPLARSMVAVFNAVDQTCQQPPFTPATSAQLSALPQASGVQLLSYADQAFIDETSNFELHNDLDYSLVLLDDFPSWSDVLLSGYTATPVSAGEQLASVSAPQGLFLKVAFSTVLPSDWDNGYDVDQTTQGRIDSGSSGSGIFDSNGSLVGLLSTGSSPCDNPDNCPNSTSCDVRGQFFATYTAFSAIYPLIRDYLNQPLNASSLSLPSSSSVFSAAPIANLNAAGYGDTTLTMNAPSVSAAEIHVGAADGPLMYYGPGVGSAQAQGWVSDGTVFFLQDVSNNQARTLANTLATATAHKTAVSFTATPPEILFPNALGDGSMTFNWTVPGATATEVHLASAAGPLFSHSGGPSGWAYAGGWVSDGLTFVLCDVSSNPCSTQNTVATFTAHVASDTEDAIAAGTSSLVAFPNPVPVSAGQSFGQTTLYFHAPGATRVQIRLGSPSGALFADLGPSGSATTGDWVSDGMTFYLQDVSNGAPGTTVATTSVKLGAPQ